MDWEIPKGWSLVSLKHLVSDKITDGPHETPEFLEDGIPFISAEGVVDNGIDFSRKRGFISKELHQEYSRKCKPQKDDIFLVKSGSTTGKSAIVSSNCEFNIWSPICIIRSKLSKILPRYFFHSVQSPYFRTLIETNWSFGTQPNIGMGVIENLRVTVPPLSEQKLISRYLDKKTEQIDRLVAKIQKKIELLKEQRTSLINQCVTKGLDPNVEMKDSGVEWIGEIPKHWNLKRLGILSELLVGYPFKSDEFNHETGIKLVRGENVSEGFLRWGSRTRYWSTITGFEDYLLKENDIVIGMDGSKVGKNVTKISDMDLPLLLVQRICRVRTGDPYLSEWCLNSLRSNRFQTWVNLSKSDPLIPHITQKNISDFKVFLPPEDEMKSLITKLTDRLKTISKQLELEEKRAELLKEYRQSLISSVVTGKVRVTEDMI